MRGWVCRLQLLLALASVVILRSESRGTRDHILLFLIRDSADLEGQVPVFISPKNRVAQLYPQALGSHFVASYDPQGYGGLFDPASTGESSSQANVRVRVRVRVRVTLRLAVYRQAVRLGVKPLQTHDQRSFFFIDWALAAIVFM
jgi:hypothetical protein